MSPQDRVGQEQADGRFPHLAIRRGRLGVTGLSDLGELVLTHHDGQHDLALGPLRGLPVALGAAPRSWRGGATGAPW